MTCLCIMLHLLYIIVSIWCTCVKNTVITSCMYINMYDCMFVDDEGCNSFVENVCSHVQYACSVDNFRSVVITKKLMLRLQKLKQCTCTQHMYTTHVHTNQCIQFVGRAAIIHCYNTDQMMMEERKREKMRELKLLIQDL